MPVVVRIAGSGNAVEDDDAAVVNVCSDQAPIVVSTGGEAGDSAAPRLNGGSVTGTFDGSPSTAAVVFPNDNPGSIADIIGADSTPVVCPLDAAVPISKGGSKGGAFADSTGAAVV